MSANRLTAVAVFGVAVVVTKVIVADELLLQAAVPNVATRNTGCGGCTGRWNASPFASPVPLSARRTTLAIRSADWRVNATRCVGGLGFGPSGTAAPLERRSAEVGGEVYFVIDATLDDVRRAIGAARVLQRSA